MNRDTSSFFVEFTNNILYYSNNLDSVRAFVDDTIGHVFILNRSIGTCIRH